MPIRPLPSTLVLPSRHPTALPFVWGFFVVVIALFLLAVGIATYEFWCAQTLRKNNAGSTVWIVQMRRRTRYLVVTQREIAILHGSGKGSRWPITDVRGAGPEPIELPRSRSKRPGLAIAIGPESAPGRYEMIFPRFAGFGISRARPENASRAIWEARDRAHYSA